MCHAEPSVHEYVPAYIHDVDRSTAPLYVSLIFEDVRNGQFSN